MGAKTALLVYTDGEPAELLRGAPEPDPEATTMLVNRTNPGWDRTAPPLSGSLDGDVYPRDGTVYAGAFPGIDILCDRQVMLDRPSLLAPHLLRAAPRRKVILHAMHSVVDWFAFAVWENGALVRSLSVAPRGVLEDIGTPLDFERLYWAGEHPVGGSPGHPTYPLPFHPLELGAEAAMRSLFGFILEGRMLDTDIDHRCLLWHRRRDRAPRGQPRLAARTRRPLSTPP